MLYSIVYLFYVNIGRMIKFFFSVLTSSTLGHTMSAFAQEAKVERPNFVWFMAEDVSKHFLNIYNEGGVGTVTPHLEELARNGLIFNNAYSNAPVSSAARSTLITSCYAPRIGVHLHRKIEAVPMPDGLHMFPYYLREVGYHTSNAEKTDYNCFLDQEAWNIVTGKMGDWRKRPDKKMPFFHVYTNAQTHESHLHFLYGENQNKVTDSLLNSVAIHPNHPDTKLFRYTYATFYECIRRSDQKLGKLVEMLKEDGELDNTFIFYFGDNGGALPGSKGYTTETGLHVPLVVYIPEKWRNKIPIQVGTSVDGVISFMDFGPTLLHLAGLEIPRQMDGSPFLGEEIYLSKLNERDEVYGYGDRFDELYAFNRTFRKGHFKYSRNFLPYHPKSLYSTYRYKQAAFHEWRSLYENGELNTTQRQFFLPQGAEELYDLSVDPYETNNLARKPEFKEKLLEMRTSLRNFMVEKCDLGIFPECVWLEEGKNNPSLYGIENQSFIQRYLDIADLELCDCEEATVREKVCQILVSKDPVERYWGATVCASWGKKADFAYTYLLRLSQDEKAYVASRAFVAMSRIRGKALTNSINCILKQTVGIPEQLLILNDLVFLQDEFMNCHIDFGQEQDTITFPCQEIKWRMKYLSERNSIVVDRE